MKNKFINEVHIKGYLYEYNLEEAVAGEKAKHPGTQYIRGDIGIATDEECLNIVKIHYGYVTEKTSKNATNKLYLLLKDMIDGKIKTVVADGKENAQKISADTAIALNEFYPSNDQEKLVSVKRNDGGFLNLINTLEDDEKLRNQFKVDILITNARRIEADEEREIPEKVIVKGAIFNYQKELKPTEFTVVNPNAMDYFEDLNASPNEPVFTKIWGRQISETVVKKIVEESAFGDDSVREVTNTNKDYIITGAAKEPYLWDDESTLTAEELKNMMSEREIYLASLKQKAVEYSSNKGKTTTATEVTDGGFNF